MKILFATSECAPFSKSGGLADVAFSLPPALKRAGEEIAIITPLYQCVRARFGAELEKACDCTVLFNEKPYDIGLFKGDRDGVDIWFVEYDAFFDRPKLYGYDDDKLRFAFFSRAIIELLPKLSFMPNIIHCNDWETAPVVIYLKNDQAWRKDLQGIKSVYTIHNMAYQGQFGVNELSETFGLSAGWYNGGLGYEFEGRRDINLMKGAMLMADAVSTVSPTYAKELHHPLYAHGLQDVVDAVDNKLRGILNGIDMAHYDSALDSRLPSNFTVSDMSGKAVCKAYLQKTFGLDLEPKFPLFCSVARLVEQKGIELIRQILPGLMDLGIQVIIFGQGEQKYIDLFEDFKRQYPGQLGFSSDYTEDMAAKIFAGSDFYLMPSRFEPCGLSQMMAMRYGTIPIVHEIGGLKDSVRPYSDFDGIGDGFSFGHYTPKDLYLAIVQALRVYFADEEMFAALRRRCMEKNFSWTKSAGQYQRMYSEIFEGGSTAVIPFEEAFAELQKVYTELDAENRERFKAAFTENYHRVIQLNVTDQTEGVVTVIFSRDDEGDHFAVIPAASDDADAYVTTSFDNFVGMAKGTVNFDKIFLSGLLKVEGNLSKGAEIRQLLGKRP